MALMEELEMQGAWLFRWRSYVPLLLIALIAIALYGYEWPFSIYSYYEVYAWSCFGVSMLGLIIRCITIGHTPEGTSGRNTKRQIANELNTTGMYSILRHPLYVGNFFIGLGISLGSTAHSTLV